MLNQFKHGFKTDLTNGIINNQDACLIALYNLCEGRTYTTATSRDLKDYLRAWRPGLQFTYLFNTSSHGGYGFVGNSHNHAANRVRDHKGSSYLRKTFWYRVTKGQYCITSEGMHRLRALGIVKYTG